MDKWTRPGMWMSLEGKMGLSKWLVEIFGRFSQPIVVWLSHKRTEPGFYNSWRLACSPKTSPRVQLHNISTNLLTPTTTSFSHISRKYSARDSFGNKICRKERMPAPRMAWRRMQSVNQVCLLVQLNSWGYLLTRCTDVEKQKQLLAEDTRHFSMIRMLHLADLITELNGMLPSPICRLGRAHR